MNIILWDYKSVWPQNIYRSLWPIFHGAVILPYTLKTVWWMNIILQDCMSVWHDIWPQNKCRSRWPIFHGPVILPYILKTIWCMNIILQGYESVWPDIWLKNKCRSLWPIFHDPVILPYILTICCMNVILWDYGSVGHIWPQNKCRSLTYFMVQWFFLLDICTPYFGIMSRYDPMFDLKINVGHHVLTYISWSSDFALYLENYPVAEHHTFMSQYDSWSSDFSLHLENYLIYEHHTLGLWVHMTQCLTSKYL